MLGTSSETHESLMPRSSPELERRAAAAVAASRTAAPERHPFPALPPGWAVIGRCRFGTGMPGPDATGCYALAHPDVGVALIDIAPDATPNAEARLRRALTAVDFWPDYPGTLPVVHDRVDGTALRSLPWVLERGFAAQPGLTIPGGTAWIEGVQRAMAADPAWELPGQPKAQADDAARSGRRGRGRRRGAAAAAAVEAGAAASLGPPRGTVAGLCRDLRGRPRGGLRAPGYRRRPLRRSRWSQRVATPAQPAPAPTAPSSAAVPADTAPRAGGDRRFRRDDTGGHHTVRRGNAGAGAGGRRRRCARARSGGGARLAGGHSRSRVPAAGAPVPPHATPPLAPAELAAAPNGIGGSGGGNGAPSRPPPRHPPMETQVSHAAPAEPRAARGAAAGAGAAADPGECRAASGAAGAGHRPRLQPGPVPLPAGRAADRGGAELHPHRVQHRPRPVTAAARRVGKGQRSPALIASRAAAPGQSAASSSRFSGTGTVRRPAWMSEGSGST